MLTHNTHYATNSRSERFVVRYHLNGLVQYITSNRRLSLDQSKSKVFDNYSQAERFCYCDICSGLAEVVEVSPAFGGVKF